jgi:Ran GTPase-activating protein (RanGAP) involved in mRNA processing and transport
MALLQNLHLHTLKLGYNNLQDTGMELLAVGIAQARELELIDLGFNNIGDEGCKILASAIAQQHALVSAGGTTTTTRTTMTTTTTTTSSSCRPVRTLYLAGNLIGQDGAMAIADLIRSGSGGEGVGEGPSSATSPSCSTRNNGSSKNSSGSSSSSNDIRSRRRNFCALQKLYLTGNRLGPEGVSVIVDALLEDEQRRLEAAAYDEQTNSNSNRMQMMITSPLAASLLHQQQQLQQQQRGAMALPRAEEKSTCSLGGGGGGSGSSNGSHSNRENDGDSDNNSGGMKELFLGGTGAGPAGCCAVTRLLRFTSHLKVLSMPNCDFGDDEIAQLSLSIKANRDKLPLESLQLSFNRITYKGIEYLTNAIWGSLCMRELRLDNNEIADRGVQQLATVLPFLRNLETLDVGFNGIQPPGMKLFMNAVAEATGIRSLSVSGNIIDADASRAVAYAMGHNRSLVSISLVHCSACSESRRHIAAGIVSNSNITIRDLSGFDMGPVVVSLGFPAPIEHWTNEQVLNFIHSMWDKCSEDVAASREEEKSLDPLHFLSAGPPSPAAGLSKSLSSPSPSPNRNVPVDAAIVVEVAKKAYESLVQDGLDVFSRRPGHPNQPSYASPIAGDTIVVESTSSSSLTQKKVNYDDVYPAVYETTTSADTSMDNASMLLTTTTTSPAEFASEPFPQFRAKSFVAAPETAVAVKHPAQRDPSRKKRIVEWLCHNIQYLNKLAQQPFSSAELWRLHQHYFAPVVNESGGNVGTLASPAGYGGSYNANGGDGHFDHHSLLIASSVPEVSRANSSTGYHHPTGDDMSDSAEESFSVPMSDPSINASRPGVISSLPLLKRKVSYRFLGDAAAVAVTSTALAGDAEASTSCNATNGGAASFSLSMNTGGRLLPSMPRKTKRARRNRSRISFVPRVKAKLDSYLDVCHEKALVTMRQLYFVEQAILSGSVNPIDPTNATRTHLSGDSAIDAEIIIVDMI